MEVLNRVDRKANLLIPNQPSGTQPRGHTRGGNVIKSSPNSCEPSVLQVVTTTDTGLNPPCSNV